MRRLCGFESSLHFGGRAFGQGFGRRVVGVWYVQAAFYIAVGFRRFFLRFGRWIVQLRAFNRAVLRCVFGGERGKREHTQQRHHKAGVFVGGERQVLFAVNHALVIQLDLLVAEIVGQLGQSFAFGVVRGHRAGHGFEQRQPLQQHGQIVQRAVEADGIARHFLRFLHELRAVLFHQESEQFVQVAFVHRANHVAHVGFLHAARTHGDGLVEQAQGIAHGTLGGASQKGERGGFVHDFFGFQNVG